MEDDQPGISYFILDPDYWGNVHGISLTVAWLFFLNVALWALHFKHKPYAITIHICSMSCAAFIMTFAPII